jgi:hypothetical protein
MIHTRKILESILKDFEEAKQAHKAIEARALFRLLNYCPPPPANMPVLERPSDPK